MTSFELLGYQINQLIQLWFSATKKNRCLFRII